MKWAGTKGNIPYDPFIVVVPASLSAQMVHEHYRFIKPGHLDVVTYDGNNHDAWWTWFDGLTTQQQGRLVIIATEKVT